jgi:hypothetical protein
VPVAVVVKKTEPGAVKSEEEQDEEELERAKESISRIRKGSITAKIVTSEIYPEVMKSLDVMQLPCSWNCHVKKK